MKLIKAIPFLLSYLKFKSIFVAIIQTLVNLKVLLSIWIVWCGVKLWKDYPKWQEGCLHKVKDGDTVEYHLKGENNIRVGRLWHIDAFEKDQPFWGNRSFQKIQALLKYNADKNHESVCQSFFVKEFKQDMYGRSLVLVKKYLADKYSINEELVMAGVALIYPHSEWPYRDKAIWLRHQKNAQLSKKGVWKYSRNLWVSPWSFRKKIKTKKSILIQTAHHKHFY